MWLNEKQGEKMLSKEQREKIKQKALDMINSDGPDSEGYSSLEILWAAEIAIDETESELEKTKEEKTASYQESIDWLNESLKKAEQKGRLEAIAEIEKIIESCCGVGKYSEGCIVAVKILDKLALMRDEEEG